MKLSSQASQLIDATIKDPKKRLALEKYISHLEAALQVQGIQRTSAGKVAAKNRRMMKAATQVGD